MNRLLFSNIALIGFVATMSCHTCSHMNDRATFHYIATEPLN